MKEISDKLYYKLLYLGIINEEGDTTRDSNIGDSDYSLHLIQPWTIDLEYNLNAWDSDIIKRVLRHKQTDPRELDYRKIIHVCEERLRQIRTKTVCDLETIDFEEVK